MPLTHMACTHCGHWHLWFEGGVPPQCLVCSDVRNALPEDGFEFHGIERVASQVRSQRNEVLPGVWGVRCEPAYGLGSVGWIIERADGNVAFEAAAFYDRDALDFIASRGGLRVASCSHPHGMGALWRLQQRFDPILPMQVDALTHTTALRVSWPMPLPTALRCTGATSRDNSAKAWVCSLRWRRAPAWSWATTCRASCCRTCSRQPRTKMPTRF